MTTEELQKNLELQKTAATVLDIAEHSTDGPSKKIVDILEKDFSMPWGRMSTPGFSAIPVSRFATTQSFLDMMIARFDGALQIVELGAGFTSHFMDCVKKPATYIEVDLPDNSSLKTEVISRLSPDVMPRFVAGDILDQTTWKQIAKMLDTDKPLIIFSEGVISPYFTDEQKRTAASLMLPLLDKEGSCFVIDDSVRNHAELLDDPIIKAGMQKVTKMSGSRVYSASRRNFSDELNLWASSLVGLKACTLKYVLSKPDMDFAMGRLNLIICARDVEGRLETDLQQLSEKNRLTRSWQD